ncbi:MAG TPA: hypothetical protein VF956_05400 [Candidatus Dormibacteraeota bacterium]
MSSSRPASGRSRAPKKRVRASPKKSTRTSTKRAGTRPSPPDVRPRTQPSSARPKPPLPGPGSSRLTIKPGLPGALRTQLVPSTKPRPSGSRRLSEVELDEDEVLLEGFVAILDGATVRITAVLERTCVYADRHGDRRLARKKDLWVEADKLPIRRRGIG